MRGLPQARERISSRPCRDHRSRSLLRSPPPRRSAATGRSNSRAVQRDTTGGRRTYPAPPCFFVRPVRVECADPTQPESPEFLGPLTRIIDTDSGMSLTSPFSTDTPRSSNQRDSPVVRSTRLRRRSICSARQTRPGPSINSPSISIALINTAEGNSSRSVTTFRQWYIP